MSELSRDPKRLTEWQRLDYFERPRSLARWRWRALALGGIAGVIPAAVVLVAVFGGLKTAARTRALTGSPSRAHASFIDDCAKCHTESFEVISRFNPESEGHRSVSDSACRNCHDAGAHAGFHGIPNAQAENCTHCHREHRGEALKEFTDKTCAACHADLSARFKEGSRFASFTTFGQHTEFGNWRRGLYDDPGQLSFSHAAHLGDSMQKARPGIESRIAKMEAAKQDAAQWKEVMVNINELSRRSCQYCHEPEAEGRYYHPISYDKHCAQCHWLKAPLQGPPGGWPESAAKFARDIDEERLSHPRPGQGPANVRGQLLERTARFLAESRYEPPASANEPLLRPMLLSRGLTPKQQSEALRQQRSAEAKLFALPAATSGLHREEALWTTAGCAYCHQGERPAADGVLPMYQATGIPTRWFPVGQFNHRSHRNWACAQCHAGAEQSRTSTDMLMPKVDDCRKCHGASGEWSARADCLTCHRYHDRGRERPTLGALKP